MAPLGVSFHLLIEDPALVLSALLVPFDSNWVYVVALGYVILSIVVPCPFPCCYATGGENKAQRGQGTSLRL